MAAVGKSTPLIYGTGIRYFKFPNRSGGYDVADWTNDRTRTMNEMPHRYFPEVSGFGPFLPADPQS